MGRITNGYTWVSGATVTADRLNQMITDATLLEAQVISKEYATGAAISAQIPVDNTTPLISEGTEILSQAITPANSTNKIFVHFSGNASGNGSNNYPAVFALFRDSTCIAVKTIGTIAAAMADVTLTVLDAPATASAVTYSVRVGCTPTGTIYINGLTSALFNGTCKQVLTLTEINV